MTKVIEEEPYKTPAILERSWTLAVGAGVGGLTLIFLMAVVILAIIGMPPPESVKFIIITIISFGLSFSTAFLGGNAAIRGAIPFLPAAKAAEFSLAGGVAAFVIILVVLSKLYPSVIDANRQWDGAMASLKSGIAKISNVDDKMIVKVNGVVLVDADYGYSGSFEFKDKLKVGENSIEVSIFNSEYGGCSGTFQIYFNGREFEKLGRSYKNDFAGSNGVCKSFNVTFDVKR